MRQIIAGEHIGVSAIGTVLPFPFGRPRGVPGQPILVGAQASLREAVNTVQTVFKLDSFDSLNRFPDSGTLIIEGEACTWTSRDFDQLALIIGSRHALSTSAASHAVGIGISESLDTQRYAFYHNPGGFSASSIDAIYVNGLLKADDVAPSHIVTVADTGAMHDAVTGVGVSVGTVAFDMTDPVSATSPFVQPQSLAALQTWQQAHDAATAAFEADWQAHSDTGNQLSGSLSGWEDFNRSQSLLFAIYAVGRQPKLLPLLGTITADVTGLLDDDSGSITGTPGSLIRNPAYCAKLILQEAFGFTSFDDASFTDAAAFADERGYAWDFLYFPTTLGELQTFVFNQSWINLFREGGTWKARFRQRGTSAMILSRDRRVSWSMSYTPQTDIVTDVTATYGTGEIAQVVTVHSDRGSARRTSNPLTISYPWVLDAAVATALANARLKLSDHQRRSAVAVMHSVALPLERVDTVGVDARMLEPYGGESLLWKVKALRWTPEALLEIPLDEEDEPEAMGLAGTLSLSGYAPSILAGRRVAPPAGALAFIGYAPTVTTGTQPGTATLTLTGYVPTVLVPTTVTPPAGSLVLTGYAPGVVIDTHDDFVLLEG